MAIRSSITATGLGTPSKVMTNKDFEKIVDTSDEWIQSRTGIKQRHFLDRENGELLENIASEACHQALDRAGVSPEEVDLVIVATTSPDTFMPNASARLVGALGAKNAAGIDQNTACAGFITALHTADSLIRTGQHKNVLVCGAEALSTSLDFSDRSTCVLFGDGAGAVLMQAVPNADMKKDSMILGSKLYTKFDSSEALAVPGGGTRTPFWSEDYKSGKVSAYIQMNGQEVFKAASKGMVRAAKEVLTETEIHPSEIKWFVPHQANLRIIEMVAKMLEFPMEKVYVNLDRWGNTSAATVAICLAEMETKGMLQKGDLLLLDVFGGGFSFGASVVRW